MGWLRDLMVTSDPPVGSFGRLAALALESPTWPADSRIKERSLSTLFSKLDHGVDLDWLRERPLVQRALAEVMRRPWGDVSAHLTEPRFTTDGRLLRLADVRYARELDLTREDLPPGLPPEVLHPPSWMPRTGSATFWEAPSGSGRSLVGAWLVARGLARHHVVRGPGDLNSLPERGPLFLELERDVAWTSEQWARLRVGERPICVASARAPALEATAFEWTRVSSPLLARVLPDLIEWVEARLGDEGTFERERAESWLRRVALPAGALRTLGDALGLLGLLDEATPRSLAASSLDELVEGFVRRRLREVGADETPAGVDREVVLFEFGELGARCLLAGQPLGEARSLDDWAGLLRGEREDAPDPSWFGAALGQGAGLSRQDLRRLTRRLPPRAYELLRYWERAGLLRRSQGEFYSLGPQFLRRFLEARATAHALRLSPYDWGRALGLEAAREELFEGLVSAARGGDEAPLTQLLDALGDEAARETSPDLVRAVEAATIAAGLATLSGRPPGSELGRELLAEAARFVVPFTDTLEPRFAPRGPVRSLYHRDIWLLAWTALTETADALPALLRPLEGDELRRDLLQVALRSAERLGAEERVALFRLLDRGLSADDGPHPSPVSRLLDDLVSAARERVALTEVWGELEALARFGGGDLLCAVAEERGLLEAALEGLVLASLDQPRLPDALGARWQAEVTRRWSPAELTRRVEAGHEVAWSRLLPHQFAGWATRSELPLPGAAAEHVPLETAWSRLEERGPSAFAGDALPVLWRRAPLRMADFARRLLDAGDGAALSRWLEAADEDGRLSTLRAWPDADDLLRRPTEILDRVRRALVHWTQAGAASAERAATLLDRVELGLLPLRRARR